MIFDRENTVMNFHVIRFINSVKPAFPADVYRTIPYV